MSSPLENSELYTETKNSFYDPEFSVAINKKMHVPDKIKLSGNSDQNGLLNDPDFNPLNREICEKMHVPERICVYGGETHISNPDPLPETKLEHTIYGNLNEINKLIQLSTPPRTLKIEDTSPVYGDSAKKDDEQNDRSVVISQNNDNKMSDSLMDFDISEYSSQNYLQLRRRILKLSYRLESLEIENRRRNKRDLFMYMFGFLYILFKGVHWFSGRNNF